jgi:hypothetical protein
MNKTIISILLIIGLVSMIGAAAAYNAGIYTADDSERAPAPLMLKPGETVILTYHAEALDPAALGVSLPYWTNVAVLSDGSLGELSSDITVTTPVYFTPTTIPNYSDIGLITITLDSNAPVGAFYQIGIGAGTQGISIDAGSASRNVSSIPEFPTVALPIATIVGLMFIISSRKKKE